MAWGAWREGAWGEDAWMGHLIGMCMGGDRKVRCSQMQQSQGTS